MNQKHSILNLFVSKGKGQFVAHRKISTLLVGLLAVLLVVLATSVVVSAGEPAVEKTDAAFLAANPELMFAPCQIPVHRHLNRQGLRGRHRDSEQLHKGTVADLFLPGRNVDHDRHIYSRCAKVVMHDGRDAKGETRPQGHRFHRHIFCTQCEIDWRHSRCCSDGRRNRR